MASYMLRNIDATLFLLVRDKLKRGTEQLSVTALIHRLLRLWLDGKVNTDR